MPVVATEDFSGSADVTLQDKTTTSGGLTWAGFGNFAANRAGLKLSGAGKLKNTTADSGATVATGSANHYVQSAWYGVGTTGSRVGVLLAAVDFNNFILVQNFGGSTIRIQKKVAGTLTTVVNVTTSFADGDVFRAEKDAGVVKLFKNGTQIGLTAGYTISDSVFDAATSVGIWGQTLATGIELMDDFEAGTIGGADPDPDAILVTSGPAANQVFQRAPGSTSKSINVAGTFSGATPDSLESRVETVGGVVVSDWATISGASIGAGTWSASVTVPQRPEWLLLKVRSIASSTTLAETMTPQFGVGVLVMIDGQSNGVGMSSDAGGAAPAVPFAKWNSGAWVTSITGAGERAFVQEFASQAGVIVGIANSAVSATGIASHTPPSSTNWTNTAAQITSMGGDCEFLLWLQGESDTSSATDTSAAYSASLQSIGNGLLTLTGRANTQFVMLVGVMGRQAGGSGDDLGWTSVRVGQALAAAAQPHIAVSHDNMDVDMQDSLHYSATGHTQVGYRFARSALYRLGLSAYDARGPRIASASISGSTVTVSFDLNGSTSLTGTGTLTGWEFYNGSTWALATDATRVGNTVTFTGAGATSVRYLYGNDPDVSNVARGNLTPSASSSVGLPVEPTRADVAVTASAVDVSVGGFGGMAWAAVGAVSATVTAPPITAAATGNAAMSWAAQAGASVTVIDQAATQVDVSAGAAMSWSAAGAVSASILPPVAADVQGAAAMAWSATGYVYTSDGSIVWPATRAGEANTARVPFDGVRVIVPNADDAAAPVKAIPLYVADTERILVDWEAKYLPGAGDTAATVLALHAPAGVSVTPSVAPGAALTTGVVVLAVTPTGAAGTYRVALRISTAGGRESTAMVDVVVSATVASAKTFRLRSTADRDVFDLDFAAKYLAGAADVADVLLTTSADAGLAADARLDVGGVVQVAVDNPSAAGTYQVRAQLQTAAGRRKTGAISVEVLA